MPRPIGRELLAAISRRRAMIRKAKAVWRGTGRAGSGQLTSDSGVLEGTPYSFKTRFENEKGTNPEELIAAAHAGCFTMALAFGLQAAGFNPGSSRRRRLSRWIRMVRDSRSANLHSRCEPRYRTSTMPASPASPGKRKRIARSRRCSMPQSRWTRSSSSSL